MSSSDCTSPECSDSEDMSFLAPAIAFGSEPYQYEPKRSKQEIELMKKNAAVAKVIAIK